MSGRYAPNGILAVRFLTTAPGAPAAPTAAEIDAGVNLVSQASEDCMEQMDGWTTTPNQIPTEDLCKKDIGNIRGGTTLGSATMNHYDSTIATPAIDAIAPDTEGWVVIVPQGNAAGNRAEVFAVEVQTQHPIVASNTPVRYQTTFAISEYHNATVA